VKQLIRYSCLVLALLFASGQTIQAQERKQLAFGAMEAMSADVAKTKAAAWLKEAGKTDQASTDKFEAIWKQTDRTVLDRLADTFALGNADAAKILTEARHPLSPAPVKVPDIIKNDAQPVFFRANLALAYARLLGNRRVFEEGLETLKLFQPEQVAEPSTYLFHRGVCEHGLLQKAEANKTIARLLGDVLDAPDRYKTVGLLMILDMQNWKDKDLSAVARIMDNVDRRLQLDRAGKDTQKLQKQVVARLDELIKELENKAKKKSPGDGPPNPNDEGCPDGGPGTPSSGPPKGGNKAEKPADDAYNSTQGGPGYVDPAKLKKLAERWNSMPVVERQQELTRLMAGMPQRHREAIENYFRNIAQSKR